VCVWVCVYVEYIESVCESVGRAGERENERERERNVFGFFLNMWNKKKKSLNEVIGIFGIRLKSFGFLLHAFLDFQDGGRLRLILQTKNKPEWLKFFLFGFFFLYYFLLIFNCVFILSFLAIKSKINRHKIII